jgi:hypothetical protein
MLRFRPVRLPQALHAHPRCTALTSFAFSASFKPRAAVAHAHDATNYWAIGARFCLLRGCARRRHDIAHDNRGRRRGRALRQRSCRLQQSGVDRIEALSDRLGAASVLGSRVPGVEPPDNEQRRNA